MKILLVFTDVEKMNNLIHFFDSYGTANTYVNFFEGIISAEEEDAEYTTGKLIRLIASQSSAMQADLVAVDISEKGLMKGYKQLHSLLHRQDAMILCFPDEIPVQKPGTMVIPIGQELPSLKIVGQLKKIIHMLNVHLELLHVSNAGETMESLYDLDTNYFVDTLQRNFSQTRISYIFLKGENIRSTLLDHISQSGNRCLLGIPHSDQLHLAALFFGHLSVKIEKEVRQPYFLLDY